MNVEAIHQYVDNSLAELSKEDMMRTPHLNMPIEMIDENGEKSNDWIPWKAVRTSLTNKDFAELEKEINVSYPLPYKEFLSYKYFYELDNIEEIAFYKHCIRDWQKELRERYFEYYEPEEIIKKGFIPFADYSDWGIVCMDTNRMKNGDCPIIYFDHETLYNETVYYEELYNSFTEMMVEMVEIQTIK